MATIHFDDRRSTADRSKRSRFAVEWPTIALAVFIYSTWLLLTYFWASIPYVVLFIAGGWTIAWHGSLQHEVLHGHPTRFRRINDAVGWPPIALWLPYALYKRAHLKHHNDEWLTDPIEDPESYYLTGDAWARTGALGRLIVSVDSTLAGRLIIGPFVSLATFLGHEVMHMVRGDFRNLRIWLAHITGSAIVLTWVLWISAMPLWIYLTAFVYAGIAFSRLRSFAEHQYAGAKEERTAIVENTPAFGLLFLHNNLHIVHHSRPQVPWYKIPKLYRDNRPAFIELNGGLVYNGYLEVARRFGFRKHHEPIHPHHPETATGTDVPELRGDQAMIG
ncbi:fatty acid desaturase [Rhizobium sp. KVB221]|uniref:Fatty acid desaturase n=1 Tax=Rhizobium setariae TaxID=2801340 RepID=A0A936YKA0_9HYPH|nr:fatty acid desaturase [Rhizobium setariae]MBL0371788.1 fatty acid desaturase [Rhizobium setariae]